MNNFIVPGRGGDVADLVAFLFGSGNADEHRDQRIIAADDALDVEDGTRLDQPADRRRVLDLGHNLDSHRKLLGVTPPGGHAWHCAVTLPLGEALSDAQWAQVTRTAMVAMGFTTGSGHAPCRWIGVHHGRSAGGHEHIHLAVNLVREDGTMASTWMDRRTMSTVCGRFERDFGLHVVKGRAGPAMPGHAESERTSPAGPYRTAPAEHGEAAGAVFGRSRGRAHADSGKSPDAGGRTRPVW